MAEIVGADYWDDLGWESQQPLIDGRPATDRLGNGCDLREVPVGGKVTVITDGRLHVLERVSSNGSMGDWRVTSMNRKMEIVRIESGQVVLGQPNSKEGRPSITLGSVLRRGQWVGVEGPGPETGPERVIYDLGRVAARPRYEPPKEQTNIPDLA